LGLRKFAPFLYKSGAKEPLPYHEIWYFNAKPYIVPFDFYSKSHNLNESKEYDDFLECPHSINNYEFMFNNSY
jgi:hypothetical protein